MIDDHPWGDNFEGPDPGSPRRHEEAPPTPGTAVDAVGLALVCAPRAATDPIGRVQAVLRAAANPPL